MSLPSRLMANDYNRGHIADNYTIPPFKLTGFKRLVYLFLYSSLVVLSISGLVYSISINPLFCILALLLCFLADNFLFAIMHVRLHAQFIEIPEHQMNVYEHHSFIHHYQNTKIYHEYWLESRIAYFIDPRAIGMNKHMLLFKIVFNMLTSALLYLIHPVIGITYFSGILAINLLQSTMHEWYHNPQKNRKKFYTPIVFWLLTGLETLKWASSKRHLRHHLHNLGSLEKAEAWLILYTPIGELLASSMWKKLLNKHSPGQSHMTTYMTKLYERALIFVQLLLPTLFILVFMLCT